MQALDTSHDFHPRGCFLDRTELQTRLCPARHAFDVYKDVSCASLILYVCMSALPHCLAWLRAAWMSAEPTPRRLAQSATHTLARYAAFLLLPT